MININNSPGNTTILGGGLSGPVLALYLARRGFMVDVYERRPDLRSSSAPEGRSINLALSKRGLAALEEIEIIDQVKPLLIPMQGRKIHDLNGKTRFLKYGISDVDCIFSVSRGSLNKTLITEAENTERVKFHFNCECTGIDVANETITFLDKTSGQKLKSANFPVFGTDGASSVVRKHLKQTGFVSDTLKPLGHSYKELNIPADENEQFILDQNMLHIWPRGEFMLIALPNLNKSFTVTLFLPNTGKVSFDTIRTGDEILNFFQKMFPDVVPLIPKLKTDYYNNPTGKLGTVRCKPWHAQGKALIIGDAAHAIVPFFGQGMNASFEDCTVMNGLMDISNDWEELFMKYFKIRKSDADSIGEMALENYVEMRELVNQDLFLKKKKLEKELEIIYPNRFISRYSMVSFHQIPYSIVQKRGMIQEKILSKFAASNLIDSVQNQKEIEKMIFKELEPLEKQ